MSASRAAELSSASSSSDSEADGDWASAEEDEEEIVAIKCFFCDGTFPSATAMLEHCRLKYNFDFLAAKARLSLDFIETIKFINYIRSEAQKGNNNPKIEKTAFAADEYTRSPLDDDPLLWSLDDLPDADEPAGEAVPHNAADLARIAQLEDAIQRLQEVHLHHGEMIQRIMAETSSESESDKKATTAKPKKVVEETEVKDPNEARGDNGYFSGYSYNQIHREMLTDKVRTDAYRDFIYENKHIFAGKTVLDVGCGTGILSMFCAKAGATRVFAVDNSDIVDRAREIVFTNGLEKTITVLRGNIEDISLPIPRVDIIVSEWMGYALLYEKMLDSVLIARDRFLAPDGLMVPSHCTIRIAPYENEEYGYDNLDKQFWLDVYGFNMSPMQTNDKLNFNIIDIEYVIPERIAGSASTFLTLPLATVTAQELQFTKAFELEIRRDVKRLDGWVLWFDTFFLPTRAAELPADAVAETWPSTAPGVAFTTGPGGKETHWGMGVMPLTQKNGTKALEKGAKVAGNVTYRYAGRGLEVEVDWEVEGKGVKGMQTWVCNE